MSKKTEQQKWHAYKAYTDGKISEKLFRARMKELGYTEEQILIYIEGAQ